MLGNEGAKFENFIAVSLLKHVLGMVDYTGKEYRLNYIRTKDDKEIDFVLVKNNNITKAIEVKFLDGNLSKNLKYFSDKYNFQGVQVVKNLKREKSLGKVDIVLAQNFLEDLFL